MTNPNYTDITLVVDRSGSMQSIKTDSEGGLATFVEGQKKAPGKATLTLIQFDDRYEKPFEGLDIQHVGEIKIVPRGWTALLDAVGRGIIETGQRLAKMAEQDRPGVVIFVIVTDGMENRSKEYTSERVRALVQEHTDRWKWQFVYIGANQDAFAQARQMGVSTQNVSNYDADQDGVQNAYAALHSNVRHARVSGIGGQSVSMSFSAEQRKSMSKQKQD